MEEIEEIETEVDTIATQVEAIEVNEQALDDNIEPESEEQKFLRSRFLAEVEKLKKPDRIETRAISQVDLDYIIKLIQSKVAKTDKRYFNIIKLHLT